MINPAKEMYGYEYWYSDMTLADHLKNQSDMTPPRSQNAYEYLFIDTENGECFEKKKKKKRKKEKHPRGILLYILMILDP